MLESKADKQEINQLSKQKCDKEDNDVLVNSIDTLAKQTKHIIILFLEYLQMSLSENESTSINEREK